MNEVNSKQPKPLAVRHCHSLRRNHTGRTSVELQRLKECLLNEHITAATDTQTQHWMRRAAEKAFSLAWATTYPTLVLPVLLQETLSHARQNEATQKSIDPEEVRGSQATVVALAE